MKALFSEFFGSFFLVFSGCGSMLFSTNYTEYEIGLLGISAAFGLSLLTMTFAFDHISGAHFNPAVSLGFWAAGMFKYKKLPGYILFQLFGTFSAAGVLFLIISGKGNFAFTGNFAANGYDYLSPGGYSLVSVFLAEFFMTSFFLVVCLKSKLKKDSSLVAPIAIGVALVIVCLVCLPISNASINPARSSSQAIIAGGAYLSQLWLFWLAPILGAICTGFIFRKVFIENRLL